MTLGSSGRVGRPRHIFASSVVFLALAICGALAAGKVAQTSVSGRRADAMAEGQFVDVGGRALNVRCKGQGAPLVLLETGGAVPAVMNYPLQDRIAQFTRACAYDRAGLGLSDPAPQGRSFEARAGDAWAALDRIGERGPYLLVGSSFGGLLARTEARQGSRPIAGLVLVDAAEEQFVFSHLEDLRHQLWQLKLAEGLARMHMMGGLLMLAPGFDRMGPVYRQVAISQLSKPGHWRAALDEIAAYDATPIANRRAGGFGSLGSIPLTVITWSAPNPRGASRSEWSQAQRRLLRLSSNTRLVIAPSKGHNIASADPAFVADEVRRMVMVARARNANH